MNRIEARDKLVFVRELIEAALADARDALRGVDVALTAPVEQDAAEWLEAIESALTDAGGRLTVTTTIQHTIEALDPGGDPDEAGGEVDWTGSAHMSGEADLDHGAPILDVEFELLTTEGVPADVREAMRDDDGD